MFGARALPLCLSLLGCQILFAGEATIIQAGWNEIPGLVQGRTIETVLRNGVHLKGKVTTVTREALHLNVTSTSDPARIRRGTQEIAKEQVSAIQVPQGSRGLWRVILSPVLAVAGLGAAYLIVTRDEGSGGGDVLLAVGLGATGGVVGYALGAKLDRSVLAIQVLGDDASAEGRKADTR